MWSNLHSLFLIWTYHFFYVCMSARALLKIS
uniref:Uncharacterized protein n=1 Tax=Siphoviridae sp. ct87j35 TaxID=2825356 RepID=A0A8S5V4H2_9CAUD|nr:MAG TPA: hypothetical protein [Siphoviridae sp. ct87j35]